MKESKKLNELLKKLKIALQLLNCYTNKSAINDLILNKLKINENESINSQTKEEKDKILELIKAMEDGKIEIIQQDLANKDSLLSRLLSIPDHEIGNLLADYLHWETERQILTLLVDIENSITIYNLNKSLVSLRKIRTNFQKVKLLLCTNHYISAICWSNYKRVRMLLDKFVPGYQQKAYQRRNNLITKI